ncbi:hypothetical protein CONLIGDRAFT_108101 [Coniochaeta ligniaria NRRL 30616]|uniref:Uncharacterized protein n=1 Tax=Coniochaeta ligniaria NRRL 30616 TaxID=1408157 RepID=A0A1J7IAA4_9PEZI|nr:hypothetical protein CONLIGDRAFT_108101 [Coniochaeta ligniaria NRRL 30616]
MRLSAAWRALRRRLPWSHRLRTLFIVAFGPSRHRGELSDPWNLRFTDKKSRYHHPPHHSPPLHPRRRRRPLLPPLRESDPCRVAHTQADRSNSPTCRCPALPTPTWPRPSDAAAVAAPAGAPAPMIAAAPRRTTRATAAAQHTAGRPGERLPY